MRRDLPARASLEHLKKQAKDLLDAHARGEAGALGRIRASLPACASMNDAAIATAPLALHDAQSVVAREYGKASWNELREAVSAQSAEEPPSEALLRALMPMPFPAEVGAKIQEAASEKERTLFAAAVPLRPSLPLLPIRNAIIVPRAIAPFHVARRASLAALDLAAGEDPPTVAAFAQRRDDDATPDDASAFHAVGCEAYLHARVGDVDGRTWVVLEGLRWIALVSLETAPSGAALVRARRVTSEEGDPAETARLAGLLRAHARDLARHFPDAERLLARIDRAEPERLADLVVANLPVSVEAKASYAEELRVVEKLRMASALSGLAAE